MNLVVAIGFNTVTGTTGLSCLVVSVLILQEGWCCEYEYSGLAEYSSIWYRPYYGSVGSLWVSMLEQLLFIGKGLAVWTGVHYAAVHGYQHFCVPQSLWGAAMSPFLIPAPHCRGLSWLIDISSASVQGVWMSAGVALSAGLVQYLPAVNIAQVIGNANSPG